MENMEMINTVEETVGTELMDTAASATQRITVKGLLTGAGIMAGTIIVWEKALKPAGKWALRKIQNGKQNRKAKKAVQAETPAEDIDPTEIDESELKIDD